ncbi:hypothetical protein CR513_38896, partial [Mucuna pruriens]
MALRPFLNQGTPVHHIPMPLLHLGSLPMAKGQVKFLLVVVDCFTKWIKAKLLANHHHTKGPTICVATPHMQVRAPPFGGVRQWHLIRKQLPARIL